MGSLLLVRHGQASWGADDYDVLSPLGWEQGRLLGRALAARGVRPDVLLCGSMRRHRETLEAVGETAGWTCEVGVDAGWDEFDHIQMLARHDPPFGDRDPSRGEFQEWFEAASERWASGSYDDEYHESFPAFSARVHAALTAAAERVGPRGTGVVFTSGGPVAWVTASLLCGAEDPANRGDGSKVWSQLNKVVVNSSVTKVVVGGRGATLVSFNEHSHLEGSPNLTYR